MTGEMQDDNLLARRWTLILTMAVRLAEVQTRLTGKGSGGEAWVIKPGSRLAPAQALSKGTEYHSLGEWLGLGELGKAIDPGDLRIYNLNTLCFLQ